MPESSMHQSIFPSFTLPHSAIVARLTRQPAAGAKLHPDTVSEIDAAITIDTNAQIFCASLMSQDDSQTIKVANNAAQDASAAASVSPTAGDAATAIPPPHPASPTRSIHPLSLPKHVHVTLLPSHSIRAWSRIALRPCTPGEWERCEPLRSWRKWRNNRDGESAAADHSHSMHDDRGIGCTVKGSGTCWSPSFRPVKCSPLHLSHRPSVEAIRASLVREAVRISNGGIIASGVGAAHLHPLLVIGSDGALYAFVAARGEYADEYEYEYESDDSESGHESSSDDGTGDDHHVGQKSSSEAGLQSLWGVVTEQTVIEWDDEYETEAHSMAFNLSNHSLTTNVGAMPSTPTSTPSMTPLFLSIPMLFKHFLPSFDEGRMVTPAPPSSDSLHQPAATDSDEPLQQAALLLKLFALGNSTCARSHSSKSAFGQSLLRPHSMLLTGPSGTGKRQFLSRICSLYNLTPRHMTFGATILTKHVRSNAQAIQRMIEMVRQEARAIHRGIKSEATAATVIGSPSSQLKRIVLIIHDLDVLLAAGDANDHEARDLLRTLKRFMHDVDAAHAVSRDSSASFSSSHRLSSSSTVDPSLRHVFLIGLAPSRRRVPTSIVRSFQHRFTIDRPTNAGRLCILRAHLALPSHPMTTNDSRDTKHLIGDDDDPMPNRLLSSGIGIDASRVDLNWVAEQTSGCVGADLVALIKVALARARNRIRNSTSTQPRSSSTLRPVELLIDDFRHALQRIRPAARHGSSTQIFMPTQSPAAAASADKPNFASTSDSLNIQSDAQSDLDGLINAPLPGVVGHTDLQDRLRESLIWPLMLPKSTFTRLGIHRGGGCLLFGIPGVGKTFLARSIAQRFGIPFVLLSLVELLKSPLVGEAERQVVEIFRMARRLAPAIIFCDEIQALFGRGAEGDADADGGSGGGELEAKLRSVLLQQIDALQADEEDEEQDAVVQAMDGTASRASHSAIRSRRVLFLAATNMPWSLDASLLRSGRISHVLHVPPPDSSMRANLIQSCFKTGMSWDASVCSPEGLSKIVEATEGFAVVDVIQLVTKAGWAAVRRWNQQRQVEETDRTKPSTSPALSSTDSSSSTSPSSPMVSLADFFAALREVSPSFTRSMFHACCKWEREWNQRRRTRKRSQRRVKKENGTPATDTTGMGV